MSAKVAGATLDSRTSARLGRVDVKLHRKLVKFGLAEPRVDDVLTPATATPAVPTVREFIDSYVAAKESNPKIKPPTVKGLMLDGKSLLLFLDERGITALDAVTPGDADDFLAWLHQGGGRKPGSPVLSDATIGRRIRRCSQFFRHALRKRLVAENVFAGVRRVAGERHPVPVRHAGGKRTG